MKGRLIALQGIVLVVVFVGVWLLLDVIAGDGISSADVLNAVISGVIFFVVYALFNYFIARRKRKRSS